MTPELLGQITAGVVGIGGVVTGVWQSLRTIKANQIATALATQLEMKKIELAEISEKQKTDESAWKRQGEMIEAYGKRITALEADKRRLEDEAFAERRACAGLIEKAQDEMQEKLRALRADAEAYQATLLNSIRALRVTCEDQETQLASLKIVNIRLQARRGEDGLEVPMRRSTDPLPGGVPAAAPA